jgi:hypothetical protein
VWWAEREHSQDYVPFLLWETPILSASVKKIDFYKTLSAPFSISWTCAVDSSNRDWQSAPPCSQRFNFRGPKQCRLEAAKVCPLSK